MPLFEVLIEMCYNISRMTKLTRKITERTGRAFGVSEIRNNLVSLSDKVDKLVRDSMKREEVENYFSKLCDELKEKDEILGKYGSFYYYNELAKNIHSCLFEEYRGMNKDKSAVLVACGPSLDDYVVNKKLYHVGVNRAFLKKGLRLDALFMHDKMMLDSHKKELAQLRAEKFIAFATDNYNSENFNLDTKEVDEISARRFIISDVSIPRIGGGVFDVINPDICSGVLMDRGGGTIFSALQFLLFTEPSRIYLVGCDCENSGYFKEAKKIAQKNYLNEINNLWLEAASFMRQYYPNLEVYSINPVKLEGVFNDMYTESFLEKHPGRKVSKEQIWSGD